MTMEKKEKGVAEQHDKSEPKEKDVNVDQHQMEMDTETETETEMDVPSSKEDEDGMVEITSFSKRFRNNIGAELQQSWPRVKSALEKIHMSCTLNLVEGFMTVSTTKKTTNPKALSRAKALVILLANQVLVDAALSALYRRLDVIKIGTEEGGLCSKFGIKKDHYKKRRKLLSRSTLESLSRVTGCDLVSLSGDRIVATGSPESLKLAQRIVEDCIVHNVRPRSQIRRIKRTKRMNRVINNLGALHF